MNYVMHFEIYDILKKNPHYLFHPSNNVYDRVDG